MKKKLYVLASLFAMCSLGMQAQTMVVVENGGTQHKFNTDYIQEIVFEEVQDAPIGEGYTFTSLTPDIYGQGNVNLTFVTADASATLVLDAYGSANAQVLEPGEYVVGAASGLYIDTDIRYTSFKTADSEAVALKSGKMTVSKNGTAYVIDIEVTLTDDTVVKGRYEGGVTGYDGLLTATSARYFENDYPQGKVYVKFAGEVRDMEMSIMFVTDVTAATGRELPVGTYTYATTDAEGTFNAQSYLDLFRPAVSARFAEGSTIVVSKDGDTYTFDMTLKTTDNVEYIVSYTGQIAAAQ